MNYAFIEDGVVTNLVWLHPANSDEFTNAVQIGDLPVMIGDTYIDGTFYRDGQLLRGSAERLTEEYMAGYDQAVLDMINDGIL